MICPNCNEELEFGEWPYCPHGYGHGGNRIAAIHTSERSVVYRNPKTGEVRYPPQADVPMPQVYARQGYVREELDSAATIKRFEKETGRIHERTHYDKNSVTAERDLALPAAEPVKSAADLELRRKLVQAIS